ncbi:MAG: flavodoxin reductase [Bacteroidetes bacterium]|nr:flavodoxin reductase [Bacteroidota bacterium]MBS1940741.1 flavodoxin reductase [Bacteroidota bacterium]
MTYAVKLLKKEKVTHDVVGITLERPANYSFTPGQYAELTLERPGKPAEKAPFSFIGLDSDPDLRVAMKTYRGEETISAHIKRLEDGDAVQISGPLNEVGYKGPGVFIAGGTGITPFMAVFRQLYKDGKLGGNMLIYANKRGEDICFEGELYTMFGTKFISILALEDRPRNATGQVDAGFIHRHVQQLEQPFYVCGPAPFVSNVADALAELGVDGKWMALYR